jgi:hypothetical protein
VGLGNLDLGLSENLKIHSDMDGGLGSLMADTVGNQEGGRWSRGRRATRGWRRGSQGRGPGHRFNLRFARMNLVLWC